MNRIPPAPLTLTFLEYKLISKIGEGTFSEVIKAQNIKTGKLVAIKCMKEKISIDKVLSLIQLLICQGQEAEGDPGAKTPAGPREHRHAVRGPLVTFFKI